MGYGRCNWYAADGLVRFIFTWFAVFIVNSHFNFKTVKNSKMKTFRLLSLLMLISFVKLVAQPQSSSTYPFTTQQDSVYVSENYTKMEFMVKNPKNLPFTMHQLIRNYVSQHSPITPTPHGNVQILDAPQTLLSQVFGVDYQFT